ncbi:hypothetical protein C8A01DRAFT_41454 [Parachaetomium inaequale]|uniref:Uncharacterized protein n=1 Tax=Parachaetomium inaequale TaxID=2588326 RepID=A0AAN6P9V2_9PEZI|nr:hypothetical protein C8A01DRAFT_41454 [Parachaetomium inaequale]
MSEIHVVFEMVSTTQLIHLSVRSKRLSSVSFAELTDGKPSTRDAALEDVPEEGNPNEDTAEAAAAAAALLAPKPMVGDGVVLYGQDYRLVIASYEFDLIW